MVRSRLIFLNCFAFFAVIAANVAATFEAVAGYTREMLAVAFPAADPMSNVRFHVRPAPVIGLPSLRAFRDSVLKRLGDGRHRSPLSVAFVT